MSSSYILDDLHMRVLQLQEEIYAVPENYVDSIDVNTFWILMNSVFVFLMQTGFAMLEVGSVSSKNTKAVLIKNMGDACIGSITWWLLGYGFAYGSSSNNFIGTDKFALQLSGSDVDRGHECAMWFFSWAFAATSATIVSGAIAERVKISAYVIYSMFITTFIYPAVVHWIWYTEGWASPLRENNDSLLFGCGAVDFAGSSVVHMVGGGGALAGVWVAKPRAGRFGENGSVNRLPQQSPALQTLGTLVLWCGWYAFNGGSSGTITNGRSEVAATAMMNSTIAPSAAAMTLVILVKVFLKKFDSSMVNNGILCGLVSITAGCALVAPEGAFIIGLVAGFVFFFGSWLLTMVWKLDDVVDATPVHLFGGIWGMLAVGLFTTETGYATVYDSDTGYDVANKCKGVFYGGNGRLLAANIVFAIVVASWSLGCHWVLFEVMNATLGLRVPPHVEDGGLDKTRQSRKSSGALLRAMAKVGGDCHVVSVRDEALPVVTTSLGVSRLGTSALTMGAPSNVARNGMHVTADTAICQPE